MQHPITPLLHTLNHPLRHLLAVQPPLAAGSLRGSPPSSRLRAPSARLVLRPLLRITSSLRSAAPRVMCPTCRPSAVLTPEAEDVLRSIRPPHPPGSPFAALPARQSFLCRPRSLFPSPLPLPPLHLAHSHRLQSNCHLPLQSYQRRLCQLPLQSSRTIMEQDTHGACVHLRCVDVRLRNTPVPPQQHPCNTFATPLLYTRNTRASSRQHPCCTPVAYNKHPCCCQITPQCHCHTPVTMLCNTLVVTVRHPTSPPQHRVSLQHPCCRGVAGVLHGCYWKAAPPLWSLPFWPSFFLRSPA